MRDADIDLSDLPKVTAETAAHGVTRVAGKVVPRGKRRLTMYLDAAVVEFYKARAGSRGYQTLINEALKQAIERESLENTLRRVIREVA
ncbi:MAG TPA: BrnA antitoxin family protein, partial [Burkholderiales bacterium]|nr:BrnA antitoxin family protein [Burkholderiales bacterium]